jgi:hypothetical protein
VWRAPSINVATALVARTQRIAIAQRPMQPAAQHAAAHGGRRAIEDSREGQLGLAGEALVEFEIAAGRGSMINAASRSSVVIDSRWGSAAFWVSRT